MAGDRGARAYPSGGRASSLRRSPSPIARAAQPAVLRARVQARPSRVRSGRGGGARGAIGGEKAHLSAAELRARDRVPVERCAAHSTGGESGPQDHGGACAHTAYRERKADKVQWIPMALDQT
jgi:hypothetical protein